MRSPRENFILIVALGILNALSPFSIDLYLPAFPQIAGELGVAVTRMSITVSTYFIGYAFGQVFYGPLLDRFGRKPPLYVGLGFYIFASIGCMIAPSFEWLAFLRFLTSIGGCAASVGAMSMVRDYFPAKESGKIFSMLMLVLSASPLLAPSLGSLIVTTWGWRTLFGALAGLAMFDVVLVAGVLPKAYEPDPTIELRLRPILNIFREIFSNAQFRKYTFAGALSFAGLFVFVAGSPAVFMDGFGVSAKGFGGIFALLAGGMIGGGQLNHFLLRRWSGEQVFRTALRAQVFLGGIFLLGTGVWQLSMATTVGLLFGYLLCAGITFPNATALALEPFAKNIGSASALLGFLQLGLGSVASTLVGLLDVKGSVPMAVVMAACSLGGWVVLKRNEHYCLERG